MDSTELMLDGNALGGLLGELFGAEPTGVRRTCQSCGQTHAVGAHRLYAGAGRVLRCPGCGDVAVVVAVTPERCVVTLRGAWGVPRAG